MRETPMTWEMKMETEPNQLEEKEERVPAALCHLAAFAGFSLLFVGHILGPLVVWLLKRDTSVFIDEHGKESLNFQFSITLYSVVALLLVVFFHRFRPDLGTSDPRCGHGGGRCGSRRRWVELPLPIHHQIHQMRDMSKPSEQSIKLGFPKN